MIILYNMKEKKEKILIIKPGYSEFLGYSIDSRKVSLGDVLRTTPILHLYKDDSVTWVTDKEAFPLLKENPYIDRILPFDWITSEQLKSEEFDKVINLEKISGICALCDKIRARKSRYGFSFDTQTGKAEAYDKAFEVLAVSSNPKSKKDNKRTTQELLFEMVEKKWNGEEYVLGYSPKIVGEYSVGLNTQVGQKWPTKLWPKEKWDKLEELLVKEGLKVTRQDKQEKDVLSNLNSYMDWINSSKVIVSNDSLGLHLGIVMRKKVLGLFGPTPSSEVYFYGRGEAILPNSSCEHIPCFEEKCITGENCINLISPESVLDKIQEYLKK
jgi:heptosyltransferase II